MVNIGNFDFNTDVIAVIAKNPPVKSKITEEKGGGRQERRHQITGGTKRTAPSQLQG